jgi:hypothetical protein
MATSGRLPARVLTRQQPSAGAGVDSRLLATIRRNDGTLQVTYTGRPLTSTSTRDTARSSATTSSCTAALGGSSRRVATRPTDAESPLTHRVDAERLGIIVVSVNGLLLAGEFTGESD